MRNFLPKVNVRKYGTYVAVVVIFVHNYVIDRDVPCTCSKDNGNICFLYMFMPSCILVILQLWTDEKFQRIFKYSYKFDMTRSGKWRCSFRFFMVLFYQIMKALCVGMLWVLAVLIDGDWYICCITYSQTYEDLACKNEKTDGDRKRIAEMKIASMKIGLCVLFCGLCCVALGTAFGCRNIQGCCDGKRLYEDLVLEEEGNVRTEILREVAKKHLINQMLATCNDESLETFFDAADTVLDKIEEAGKKTQPQTQTETQQKIPQRPVCDILKEILEKASQEAEKKTQLQTQTKTQQKGNAESDPERDAAAAAEHEPFFGQTQPSCN